VFDLFIPKSRKQHAPKPKLTPRICILFPTPTIALNPPPLKLYDCANIALDDINELAKGQGYVVLQAARMVEVKMPLQMACQVLAAIFHRLTAIVGPCPFSTTLPRGPLAHSSSDLNSTSCTIVEIKT
jgi:hypothetical protein